MSLRNRVRQHSPSVAQRREAAPGRVLSLEEIDEQLGIYGTRERQRLGLIQQAVEHWADLAPRTFTRAQRKHTTLLFGGLTRAQDNLLGGALRGIGYNVIVLETPDNESLRFGKEFGNRGQCNPTYFTVGNLVKYLTGLRDDRGLSTGEIIDRHVFITAGACGPCRFGTYITEYRKALRDAGFDGFRVLLFQQQGGLRQACGAGDGLELNPRFFLAVLRAVMAGDVLNAVGYRIRPYETIPGTTNAALEACERILHHCLSERHSLLWGLWRCRRILRVIAVNRLQPKPKVSVIGEFWAMTTEGDGNYRLQHFLESEGAEVDVQLVTSWLLYNIWQSRWDTKRRMTLRREDAARSGLEGKHPRRRLVMLRLAEIALRGVFKLYAKLIGLAPYTLPDLDELAAISHPYYDNHLRGGEGHMEVAKLLQTVNKKTAHMVVSVKPFGCLPSSGVSDGIQSLITEKHPDAIFCAIETTGDGAVTAQSRVQMALFRARQVAREEYLHALDASGWTQADAERRLARMEGNRPLFYPRVTGYAGTGARLLRELGSRADVLHIPHLRFAPGPYLRRAARMARASARAGLAG
jgi:predicted nucleotide-binding protein (sugar kinase/HSP70/actin superfamily)